jgi:hypothetical protein
MKKERGVFSGSMFKYLLITDFENESHTSLVCRTCASVCLPTG